MAEHPGPRELLLTLFELAILDGQLTEEQLRKPLDAIIEEHGSVLEGIISESGLDISLDDIVRAVKVVGLEERLTELAGETGATTPAPGPEELSTEALAAASSEELSEIAARIARDPTEWPATARGAEATDDLTRFAGILENSRLQEDLLGFAREEGELRLSDQIFGFSDPTPFDDRTWVEVLRDETRGPDGDTILSTARGFAVSALTLQKPLYQSYVLDMGRLLEGADPDTLPSGHPALETFFSWLDRNGDQVRSLTAQRAFIDREKDIVQALKDEREFGELSDWAIQRKEEINVAARSRQAARVPGILEGAFQGTPFGALEAGADGGASLQAALSRAFTGPILPREGESQLAYMNRTGAVLSEILNTWPGDPALAPSADALVAAAVASGFVLTVSDLQTLGQQEQARVLEERGVISNLSRADQALFNDPTTSPAQKARLLIEGREVMRSEAFRREIAAFEQGKTFAEPELAPDVAFAQFVQGALGDSLTTEQAQLLVSRGVDVREAFNRAQQLQVEARKTRITELRDFAATGSPDFPLVSEAETAALFGSPITGEPGVTTPAAFFNVPQPLTMTAFLQQEASGLVTRFEEEAIQGTKTRAAEREKARRAARPVRGTSSAFTPRER